MKKLISLTAVLLCFLGLNIEAKASHFSDVEDSFYQEAIEFLANQGIISGYPDGSFKPYDNINRAEFLKLLIESEKIPLAKTKERCFPDVPNSQWYSKYVCTAAKLKIVNGYPDGTFRPDQKLSKIEALKIIGEVFDWELEDKVKDKDYQDTDSDQWYSPYLNKAKNHKLLPENGTYYKPYDKINRSEIAEILYRKMTGKQSAFQQENTKVSIEEGTEIILEWVKINNSDFDLYLLQPNGSEINFRKKYDKDGAAILEIENQKEKITILKKLAGKYELFVHNFNEKQSFQESLASIKIIQNGDQIAKFHPPQSGSTNQESIWKVLEINSKGQSTTINEISDCRIIQGQTEICS